MSRRLLKICIGCGIEYEGWAHAKSFHSLRCHAEWKKRTGFRNVRAPAAELDPQIIELYKSGLGVRLIVKKLGLPINRRRYIQGRLKEIGILDSNRKSPMTLPRGKGAISAKSFQREAWKREWPRRASREYDCPHWVSHPEAIAAYNRHKDASNRKRKTNYYLSKLLRSRIYRVLKGQLKSAPTLQLLGCSIEELKVHLQNQFKRGMNWNNQGHHWHIDHIVPCAAFDLSRPEEQRKCFHFTNLQPLEATRNWSKHARIEPCQPLLTI